MHESGGFIQLITLCFDITFGLFNFIIKIKNGRSYRNDDGGFR